MADTTTAENEVSKELEHLGENPTGTQENQPTEQPTGEPPEPEVIPAAKQGKTAEADSKPAGEEGEGTETPPPADAEPAYTPNTKFKAMKVEKEYEDWVKPLLTKENEGKIRELHEKAFALEPIKAERDQIRQEIIESKKYFNEFYNEVQRLGTLSKSDFGQFLEDLEIPKTKVFQWVKEQLEIEQLPEAEKRVYYENQQLKRERAHLTRQQEESSRGYVDQVTQARVNDLNNTLSDPSIASHVQQFDSRIGRPGAFMDMVIRHAKSEWEISQGKKDLSAKEAVNEVLNILGVTTVTPQPVPAPNQGAIPKGPATTQAPTVIPSVKPTVIPNVGAGSSSASLKIPKSLDDLRKLSKELSG